MVLFLVLAFSIAFEATHAHDSGSHTRTNHAANQTIQQQGIPRFAVDLYKNMAKYPSSPSNLAISPFSAETALTLAFQGANGTTKTELSTVLGLASSKISEFVWKVSSVNSGVSPATYSLETANGLFFDHSFALDHAYRNEMARIFDVQVELLDFQRNAEESRLQINAFVANKTRQKIGELFAAGSIGQDSSLVLVNALYFKAQWETPFDKDETNLQPFELLSGQRTAVPLMFTEATVPYGVIPELKNAEVIELMYKGGAVSMIVILPAKKSSLHDLEDSLTTDKMNAASKRMMKQEVLVFLPKFKVSGGTDLVPALKDMGVTRAFSSDADFSRINQNKGLQITQVFQEVVLDVDEMGTEGAAATGVQVSLQNARPHSRPVFRATRPFLYFIRHNQSNIILFFGHVTDPSV
ncbi:Plasminogen activator inhibitor 2 [Hypsibius exemplaris]|uniref:Plasminogen activator inhibitor 2 n=1 Tax=Hypsibius exemplaris TaxID=2072580 RepID=A0A9X6RKD3_HYPEX|nr:Plasminogen activator inhibitor 2 [Hypsibius exemplaris]